MFSVHWRWSGGKYLNENQAGGPEARSETVRHSQLLVAVVRCTSRCDVGMEAREEYEGPRRASEVP